jgi:A/G-specific adenine glycosylase
MDLGSLVCGSRAPQCASCPLVESGCAWRTGDERPDPAVGTAYASRRQARFAGSDREGRGRLVKAACEHPIPRARLAELAGWPDDPARADKVASALVREGVFVEVADGALALT